MILRSLSLLSSFKSLRLTALPPGCYLCERLLHCLALLQCLHIALSLCLRSYRLQHAG